jgi:D-glycero-D-manno-heptose 1,7-bisphosphate phosphatase
VSTKAAFLDRDGIINELVYFPEHGIVDSPFTPEQVRLTPFAIQAVNRFHDMGYKVIVISNQPGMAKGHFDEPSFDLMSNKMRELLRKGNATIDGEYYCFHHPNGVRKEYSRVCDCRKPKPGLILKAAREHDISLADSFMLGDGSIDVKAGRDAGCTTILVASTNDLLMRILSEQDARPDYIARTLEDAVQIVEDFRKSPRTS